MVPFFLSVGLLFQTASAPQQIRHPQFHLSLAPHPVWMELSPRRLALEPSLFEDLNAGMPHVDPALLQAMGNEVKAAEAIYYIYTPSLNGAFVDNLNIRRNRASLPANEAELQQACEGWDDYLSKTFDRPIQVYACHRAQVDNRQALYLEFDGKVPGTLTMQWHVQVQPRELIIITATLAEDRKVALQDAVKALMATIDLG